MCGSEYRCFEPRGYEAPSWASDGEASDGSASAVEDRCGHTHQPWLRLLLVEGDTSVPYQGHVLLEYLAGQDRRGGAWRPGGPDGYIDCIIGEVGEQDLADSCVGRGHAAPTRVGVAPEWCPVIFSTYTTWPPSSTPR